MPAALTDLASEACHCAVCGRTDMVLRGWISQLPGQGYIRNPDRWPFSRLCPQCHESAMIHLAKTARRKR